MPIASNPAPSHQDSQAGDTMIARPRIRWWPPVLIVSVAVATNLILAAAETADRQSVNMISIAIGIGAVLLVLIWCLAFSRLPGRRRLGITGGLLGAVAAFFGLFRVEGVDGDLVPIFGWRFRSPVALSDPPPVPADTPPAAVVPGLQPFPQFFGPSRDGHLDGPKLAVDWTLRPPRLLWRQPVGLGWSGFVVEGRRAITHEQHGDEEVVVCRDLFDGEVVWTRRVPARFENTVAGIGPRATPTLDDDRVFALGATGVLECLDLASGRPVWSVNILATNGADVPEWGLAGSPLIVDGLVVVGAGGPRERSLVAYHKATGIPAWSGGDAAMHWSSPIRVRLAGVDQVLLFQAQGLAGHDSRDGRLLWTHPWRSGHPRVSLPVVAGEDSLWISSGYGTGCQKVAVDRDDAGRFLTRTVWASRRLKAKFANFLAVDGQLYGLDDGMLTCVDGATGARRWKRGRYGHGQLLRIGGVLLVTTEQGAVVLVAVDPEAHRELASLQVFDGKTWNPPALAGRFLVVRNHEEAACFELPLVE